MQGSFTKCFTSQNSQTLEQFFESLYGCTPICVNGVVDMGVYQFQKDLMDDLIKKAFVRGKPCQDMEAAWHRFGNRMVSAIKGLLGSPQPVLPLIAQGLSAILDPEEAELENEANISGAYSYLNSGADAVMGSDWSMGVLRFDHGEAAARNVFTASGMPQSPFPPFLSSSPPEASTARLMAASLQHTYTPNGCIDPALIKNPPAMSALSAAVASMGFEAQAAPSMHAAGSLGSSAGPIEAGSPPAGPFEDKSPPACSINAESPPAGPMEAKSPPAYPINAELPPAQPIEAESPPAGPIEATSPPTGPFDAKSPSDGPIAAGSPPAGPMEANSPPAGPIRAVSPPAGPVEVKLPLTGPKANLPSEPFEATPPPAEPMAVEPSCAELVKAEQPSAEHAVPKPPAITPAEAKSPSAEPIEAQSPSASTGLPEPPTGGNLFDDGSDLSDPDMPQEEPLASAAKGTKAAKRRLKSAVAATHLQSTTKRQPGRRVAKHAEGRPSKKRPRSLSMESEDSPPTTLGHAREHSLKPAPKARWLKPSDSEAPMMAAFLLDLTASGRPKMQYADLFQPSMEPADSGDDESAMDVDLPPPGLRKVMNLMLPTAIYNSEADEIWVENQPFCFPYYATVCAII